MQRLPLPHIAQRLALKPATLRSWLRRHYDTSVTEIGLNINGRWLLTLDEALYLRREYSREAE
jgi:hypothetical protein